MSDHRLLKYMLRKHQPRIIAATIVFAIFGATYGWRNRLAVARDMTKGKTLGSPVVVKAAPALPLLSATLEYAESQRPAIAAFHHKRYPISDLKSIAAIFWKDNTSLLVSSLRGTYFSSTGFRFRAVSLVNGKVSDAGEFGLSDNVETDPAGLTMYQENSEEFLLWNMSRYKPSSLPYSALAFVNGKMQVIRTARDIAQSSDVSRKLNGRLLRPFGRRSEACTNTSGESEPIVISDAVTREKVRFNLPQQLVSQDDSNSVPSTAAQSLLNKRFYRIEPTVQPLVLDTGTYYVGLLMMVAAQRPCFTERPALDLFKFKVPHPPRGKETELQDAGFSKIPGTGEFLTKLRQKWRIIDWNIGTIEWAELVDNAGALVLRRDTRVGAELWCSEIWYYDAEQRGTLIDFMTIVREGGYNRRFSIDEQGGLVAEPHRADYWGIGHNMVPSISPDKKRIAYSKWDSIWVAELPKG